MLTEFRISSVAAAVCSIAAVLNMAGATASAEYHYEPVTADGRPIRYLLDSNDQGEMVGSVASIPPGSLEGFRRGASGSASFWSNPGFLTYPTAINNAGVMVGVNIPVPAALPQGFWRDASGVETPYNFPGALGSIPFGVNNNDLVSGFHITPTGRKGFVRALDASLSRSVEYPGAVETQLFALNDLGLVGGGYYDAAGTVWPFLYDVTTEAFTVIPKPIASGNFIVSSVNESGDALVFGMKSAAEGYADSSSYVYDVSTGTLTQLVYPGAIETYGYELRDDGMVLGYYQNPDGSYGGFTAAIPEPASLSLLGSCGLILLARCRCRSPKK